MRHEVFIRVQFNIDGTPFIFPGFTRRPPAPQREERIHQLISISMGAIVLSPLVLD